MTEIRQATAVSLKQGSYVMFDNVPCIVRSIQTSRPGKHGHAKCRIEAIGMITNQKIVKVLPGHDKVDVPIIEKKTAQVLSISGNNANVMDLETYETFDLNIPDKLKENLQEGSQVLYWIVLNDKVMKQIK